MEGTNLREAEMEDADLSEADLRGADLAGADFQEANLRAAKMVRLKPGSEIPPSISSSYRDLKPKVRQYEQEHGDPRGSCTPYVTTDFGVQPEHMTSEKQQALGEVNMHEIDPQNFDLAKIQYMEKIRKGFESFRDDYERTWYLHCPKTK